MFSLAGDEYSSNRGYFTDNKTLCPIHVKFKSRLKFPPRVLMWIAISENGFFWKPFFLEKGNMNGNVYLKECIKKRLLPFIAQKNATLSFGRMAQQLTTKNVLKKFLMTMRFHTLLKFKIPLNFWNFVQLNSFGVF